MVEIEKVWRLGMNFESIKLAMNICISVFSVSVLQIPTILLPFVCINRSETFYKRILVLYEILVVVIVVCCFVYIQFMV